MTRNLEWANFLLVNVREDARRNDVCKLRTDANAFQGRKPSSGTLHVTRSYARVFIGRFPTQFISGIDFSPQQVGKRRGKKLRQKGCFKFKLTVPQHHEQMYTLDPNEQAPKNCLIWNVHVLVNLHLIWPRHLQVQPTVSAITTFSQK